MAWSWSWMEHGPTTTISRSSAPCRMREMAARLRSTNACAAGGTGSHSFSSAGVISGRTAPMRVSSMRVVSWVVRAAWPWTWAGVFISRIIGQFGIYPSVKWSCKAIEFRSYLGLSELPGGAGAVAGWICQISLS
jgi:hypothetical protein